MPSEIKEAIGAYTPSKEVSIKIPIYVQSPNVQEHWRKKANRNKKHELIIKSFLDQSIEANFLKKSTQDGKTKFSITLTRISPKKLDYDNLCYSFKPILDSICSWLRPSLKKGQADKDVHVVYFQKKGNTKEYAFIVEIYPI